MERGNRAVNMSKYVSSPDRRLSPFTAPSPILDRDVTVGGRAAAGARPTGILL